MPYLCNKKRVISFLLALMVSNLMLAPLARGQSESSTTNGIVAMPKKAQDDKQTQLPPLKINLSRERTGVDPNKVLNLSLRDAISMALEHNLDIQIERDNIKLAEYNLLSSLGVYDISLGSELSFGRQNSPSSSSLDGSGNRGSVQRDNYNYKFSVSRLLTNGSRLESEFSTNRSSTTSSRNLFNPVYNSSATFTFRQPLMKDYRVNSAQRNIRSAKKQLDISDLTFRQKLIDLIARVQSAYYELIFALRNEEIQLKAVELAAIQLRNNEVQVNAGTVAPIEIVSSEAALEQRKDDAIAALNNITQAENTLKNFILDDPNSDIWNYCIVPTEQIEFTPDPIDLQSAFNIAMDRRPEIKELELRNELNKIDLEFLKNQEKPQVDLFTSFGLSGLGGQPSAFTDPTVPGSPPIIPKTPFNGGFGKSITTLFDSRAYQFGITFNLPLRNRTAKANFSRALVEGKQLDARKRQMLQAITLEVRNAVQAVDAARQRVEATHAAVLAAQKQLEGEEQKFAVGLSSNFLVLERQNNLSAARGSELRAKIDYNKARAELQRVMANNIP